MVLFYRIWNWKSLNWSIPCRAIFWLDQKFYQVRNKTFKMNRSDSKFSLEILILVWFLNFDFLLLKILRVIDHGSRQKLSEKLAFFQITNFCFAMSVLCSCIVVQNFIRLQQLLHRLNCLRRADMSYFLGWADGWFFKCKQTIFICLFTFKPLIWRLKQ